MYKPETVRKAVNMLRDRVAHYDTIPARDIPVCISAGNDKIGHALNVSSAPVLTCGGCMSCGCPFWCYDVGDCLRHPNSVIDARARNTSVLMRDRDYFFQCINAAMDRRKRDFYFRYHVAGEILDSDYFGRMVQSALDHPHFVVWTYTKKYGIVNDWCRDHGGRSAVPENMHVMFSEWRGLPVENPYDFPVFRVFDDPAAVPAGDWVCPGNCDICKAAGRGCVAGETSWAALR